MAWDIAVTALIGMGAFFLGYIGVEFIKISIFKEDGKKTLWALVGAVFIGGGLGLVYGGFGFCLQVIDSQDPTAESALMGLLSATYSFYGWFITGLLFIITVLVFWFLIEKLIDIIKKPLKTPEELLKEDEES